MANTKSAAKRARQTITRTSRNKSVLTAMRNQHKKVLAQIKAGGKEAARKELHALASLLDRAAKRGVIHKNAADRSKSRLDRVVAAIAS